MSILFVSNVVVNTLAIENSSEVVLKKILWRKIDMHETAKAN